MLLGLSPQFLPKIRLRYLIFLFRCGSLYSFFLNFRRKERILQMKYYIYMLNLFLSITAMRVKILSILLFLSCSGALFLLASSLYLPRHSLIISFLPFQFI
ncbi:uncharacterized protein A4U43_C04F5020 [Asparagus officinalis]|uniref:Uncharacterized protein n=1 Tax=Asparagus officinalis TaxID=4686 RepID=A0A5P1F3U6_ASPOF|nr:uncharacterized protein A4U43_C04F5020 [Asparagus officinalis]